MKKSPLVYEMYGDRFQRDERDVIFRNSILHKISFYLLNLKLNIKIIYRILKFPKLRPVHPICPVITDLRQDI
jgi:hypothetical protein